MRIAKIFKSNLGLYFFWQSKKGRFFTTTVPWWSVVLSFGFSTLVGIIFGVAPAIRASRLDPIEALRHE